MGPESLLSDVGSVLEARSVHLQHPLHLPEGIRYVNPHWFYSRHEPRDLRHLIGPPTQDSEFNSERISKLIRSTLGSLDKPSFPGDERNDLPGANSYPNRVSEGYVNFTETKLKPLVFLRRF